MTYAVTPGEEEGKERSGRHRRAASTLVAQTRQLVRAIGDGDERSVEAAVMQLSRTRRAFAPLALAVGAFAMLFQGLKALVNDWHLLLIQLLPAMWIWAAMLDLKVHVVRGNDLRNWHGAAALLTMVGIVIVTVCAFFLNAVFAFAVTGTGPATTEDGGAQQTRIRWAMASVRRRLPFVLACGAALGIAFAYAAVVVPRFGRGWFALALGIVVAVMMLTYVAIPARMVGVKRTISRRDRLTASVVAGVLGAVVCAPTYTIGRLGTVLLGSSSLFVLGVVLLTLGLVLEAGATAAVKAIKVSAKLTAKGPDARVVSDAGPVPTQSEDSKLIDQPVSPRGRRVDALSLAGSRRGGASGRDPKKLDERQSHDGAENQGDGTADRPRVDENGH